MEQGRADYELHSRILRWAAKIGLVSLASLIGAVFAFFMSINLLWGVCGGLLVYILIGED